MTADAGIFRAFRVTSTLGLEADDEVAPPEGAWPAAYEDEALEAVISENLDTLFPEQKLVCVGRRLDEASGGERASAAREDLVALDPSARLTLLDVRTAEADADELIARTLDHAASSAGCTAEALRERAQRHVAAWEEVYAWARVGLKAGFPESYAVGRIRDELRMAVQNPDQLLDHAHELRASRWPTVDEDAPLATVTGPWGLGRLAEELGQPDAEGGLGRPSVRVVLVGPNVDEAAGSGAIAALRARADRHPDAVEVHFVRATLQRSRHGTTLLWQPVGPAPTPRSPLASLAYGRVAAERGGSRWVRWTRPDGVWLRPRAVGELRVRLVERDLNVTEQGLEGSLELALAVGEEQRMTERDRAVWKAWAPFFDDDGMAGERLHAGTPQELATWLRDWLARLEGTLPS